VLLGYWGLGPEGLSFFDKVKSEFLSRVKLISLAVDAASPGGTYRVEMQGTTLRVVFPLDEIRSWPKVRLKLIWF
jgi:hypothetical protein